MLFHFLSNQCKCNHIQRLFLFLFGTKPFFGNYLGRCVPNDAEEMEMDRLPNISTSNTTLSGFAMGRGAPDAPDAGDEI